MGNFHNLKFTYPILFPLKLPKFKTYFPVMEKTMKTNQRENDQDRGVQVLKRVSNGCPAELLCSGLLACTLASVTLMHSAISFLAVLARVPRLPGCGSRGLGGCTRAEAPCPGRCRCGCALLREPPRCPGRLLCRSTAHLPPVQSLQALG